MEFKMFDSFESSLSSPRQSQAFLKAMASLQSKLKKYKKAFTEACNEISRLKGQNSQLSSENSKLKQELLKPRVSMRDTARSVNSRGIEYKATFGNTSEKEDSINYTSKGTPVDKSQYSTKRISSNNDGYERQLTELSNRLERIETLIEKSKEKKVQPSVPRERHSFHCTRHSPSFQLKNEFTVDSVHDELQELKKKIRVLKESNPRCKETLGRDWESSQENLDPNILEPKSFNYEQFQKPSQKFFEDIKDILKDTGRTSRESLEIGYN